MEEIIVERTIVTLSEHLQGELVNVWEYNAKELLQVNPSIETDTDVPFTVSSDDFFRFNLGEKVSSKNYRFIVSAQRGVADSDHRGDIASEYDLEILFLFDYRFGENELSRYYIPMRVRQAIIQAVEKNSREITNRSSNITLHDFLTAEATGKGSRTVMAGVLYKTVV